MNENDYCALTRFMTRDVIAAVRRFAQTDINRDIDALALSFSFYGLEDIPCLFINSSNTNQISTGSPQMGVQQERFNPWGFSYSDTTLFSTEVIALLKRFGDAMDGFSDLDDDLASWKNGQRYEHVLIDVIRGLDAVVSQLRTVPTFIRYVWLTNTDPAHTRRLMEATVPPCTFNEVFPEYSREQALRERIKQLTTVEQVLWWARVAEDWYLARPSAEVEALKYCNLRDSDAVSALCAVGLQALPTVLELIDRHGRIDELELTEVCATDGSIRWRMQGNKDFVFMLASHLPVFKPLPETAVGRIRRLIQELYTRDQGRERAGMLCNWLAYALHRARPDIFPVDRKFRGDTNHLTNPEDFGLE